ncbi:MAG: hypothetical protein Q9207_006473 [Kuettlingeria erythrocarpa]
MNLPNEVVLMLLGHLPQSDLKRTRLACKKLASLGGRLLIGTLHISPRDADMEVFDCITQHPDLSKSVKNVFFDSSRFHKYHSTFDFCADLRRQFMSYDYQKLRRHNAAVRRCTRVVKGLEARDLELLDEADGERCRYRPLYDGYQDYLRLAEQQQNVMKPSWLQRVLHGLGVLGPIHAVTVGSTFEIRLDPDLESDDGELTIFDVPEDHWSRRYDANRDNFTSRATCIQLSADDLVVGKRSVGSPIARHWPFTSLQPRATEFMDIQEHGSSEEYNSDGVVDGSFSFLAVVQLLGMAKKWPTFFGVMANAYPGSGIPCHLFGLKWPCDTPSLDVGNRLSVLRLRLSGPGPLPPSRALDRLKPLFHDSSSLQELTLDFPANDPFSDRGPYDFSQVFPPIVDWSLVKLRYLKLSGLRVSTRDLVGLLYISLPSLKELKFGLMGATDGDWLHTIPGLRSQTQVERCTLGDRLLWSCDCHTPPSSLLIDQDHGRSLVRVRQALIALYALYKDECEAKSRCARIIDQIGDTLRTHRDKEGSDGREDDEDEGNLDDGDVDEEDSADEAEDYGVGDIEDWDSDEENAWAAIMQSSHRGTSTDGETD